MTDPLMAKTAEARGELEHQAEGVVLELVQSSGEPVAPRELLDAGKRLAEPLPEFALLAALWNLVRDGKIEFTSDWRLRPAR